MRYYSEPEGQALREAFEQEVLYWPQVSTRRMFGCPAYLADGRLFAFLVTDGVVITQLRTHDRAKLAEAFPVAAFRIGEREITRWTQVTVDDMSRFKLVLRMVEKSYRAVLNA